MTTRLPPRTIGRRIATVTGAVRLARFTSRRLARMASRDRYVLITLRDVKAARQSALFIRRRENACPVVVPVRRELPPR